MLIVDLILNACLSSWLAAASRGPCHCCIRRGPTSPSCQSQSSFFQWTEDQLINQGSFELPNTVNLLDLVACERLRMFL